MLRKISYLKITAIATAALLFFIITGIILYKSSTDNAEYAFAENHNSRMLIIDPGHGGADGGAVAADGSKESEINLQLSKKINELAGILGVNTLMTRDSEDLPYPSEINTIAQMKRWDQRRRLEIINSHESAVYISIHQNKYPDPRPYGPQVLYGQSSASEALGEICHKLLNEKLCPENRRLPAAASKDIYLMKNAKCTAILVECGFISNEAELYRLKDETYQKKLAAIILKSYLDFSAQ